jgi:hypothetical protein
MSGGFLLADQYWRNVYSENSIFYFSEHKSGAFENAGEREHYELYLTLGYTWRFWKGFVKKKEGSFSLVLDPNGNPFILFGFSHISANELSGMEKLLKERLKEKLRQLSVESGISEVWQGDVVGW